MNLPIPHNQDPKGVGSTVGAPPPQGPGSGAPIGDDALMKAMLMQILELSSLSDAATSEASVSVALRKSMQGRLTDTVEEYQKLLDYCAAHEGSDSYSSLRTYIIDGMSFSALATMDPDLNGVPTACRGDFMSELKSMVDTNSNSAEQFRTRVGGTIGPLLSQYGTEQSAAKNLADAYQNGASSLTQSITQFLAQLATESGLSSDVVAQ